MMNMENLYFESQHIDYIGRGENKFTLFVAYKSDPKLRIIGYIDYSLLNTDELYVDFVEVLNEERGKGIAKSLYRKLYELNKQYSFERAGYYSHEGSHIRKWFEENILQMISEQKVIK